MKPPHFSVIVIGAGITGIGAGYHLAKAGISYAILEAKPELGGVWHTHRWHGARCDSDFIKYSFSFKPSLSDQCLQPSEAIRRYLREVAEEFSIVEHIRFDTRVEKAVFDPAAARWTVHTGRGAFTADFLLNGNGYFSEEPYVPRLAGMDGFRGELVHASRLDGRRTFHGKRIVVVGSGSTAICCAPELARVSKSVVLVQRSPSYIYETDNRAGPLVRLCQGLQRRGLRFPVRWLRRYLQLRDDLIFVGFRRLPGLARRFFRGHWRASVGEAALREHFSPRYKPWEQRIPVAIGLKAALAGGRVAMRTGEIARFEPSAIVLASGERLACDVCVLATGLNLRFFGFELYVGERRIVPEGINFYMGLLAGGVPNYFHPLGSWHSAWTQRCEPLTRLAIRIMRHMKRRGFATVGVERRELPLVPGITPNYVMRAAAAIPRLEGTFDLPSIDNLLAALFDPARLRFSARPPS
jgi:monooxygenase